MPKNILIAFFFGIFLVAQFPAFAVSVPAELEASADKTGIPQTRHEHLAMARRYQEKAVQYHAEANLHRKMIEDYQHEVGPTSKSSSENTWMKEMRAHCDRYIEDADHLADEAIKFSEYHLMRARELDRK